MLKVIKLIHSFVKQIGSHVCCEKHVLAQTHAQSNKHSHAQSFRCIMCKIMHYGVKRGVYKAKAITYGKIS